MMSFPVFPDSFLTFKGIFIEYQSLICSDVSAENFSLSKF